MGSGGAKWLLCLLCWGRGGGVQGDGKSRVLSVEVTGVNGSKECLGIT